MRISAILAAIVTLPLLAGCGEMVAKGMGVDLISADDAGAVYRHTQARHDPHSGTTMVKGPAIFRGGYVFADSYRLRAFYRPARPDEGTVYQIYVEVRDENWLRLEQAYSQGEKIETTVIDRQRRNCSDVVCTYVEALGLIVSEETVRALAETGLEFKVVGRRGDRLFNIAPAYFQGFLRKFDELHNSAAG